MFMFRQVVSRLMQLLGDRILGMKKKGPPAVINNKLGSSLCIPASNRINSNRH